MRSLLKSSLARSTRRSYRAAYRSYRSFHTTHYGTQPRRNISENKLTGFIAYCYAKGLKYSTICSRVSALNYINKLQGGNPIGQSLLVKRILIGYKKRSSQSDKRRPITVQILKRLIKALPRLLHSNYNVHLFCAMFSLSFFALLRVGEIAISTAASHTLRRSDVKVKTRKDGSPVCLSISLNHFKHSITPFHLILKPAKQIAICPVRAIHKFLTIRPRKKGPLFVNKRGVPVSTRRFGQLLAKSLEKIGLDPKVYTSHSFRIGGATLAHSNQLSDAQIRSLGRWRSNAFHTYLRPSSLKI